MSENFSKSQVQALINEYKGNLFESLVGREIASKYQIEDLYWLKMSPTMLSILKEYESKLRAYNPAMMTHMSVLAKKFAADIVHTLPKKMTNVFLVGKLAANQAQFRFPDADIILETSEGFLPVSIKLSKDKAFVNTKSAGIKSFFPKYVTHPKASLWQHDINRKLDLEFSKMARELYEDVGLEFEGDEKFSRWSEQGYSILPGQLSDRHKKIIHYFYVSMRDEIYHYFEQLSSDQLALTANQLAGQRAEEMMQLICFHSGTDQHEYARSLVLTQEESNTSWELGKKTIDLTSFELKSKKKIVQVRMKAMNSFIVPALKVNCSVKYDF